MVQVKDIYRNSSALQMAAVRITYRTNSGGYLSKPSFFAESLLQVTHLQTGEQLPETGGPFVWWSPGISFPGILTSD